LTVNTTKITGFIVLPNDTIREQSKVIFTMTGFDTDADDNATVVPIPIEAPIAVDGSIDIDMWPNPEGVRTTYYRVTFSIYNGNKPYLVDGGLIEVPVSGGPYDLNDLLPVSPPSGATVDEYIAQLAAAVASAEAAAAAADNEKFRFASFLELSQWWAANAAPPDGVVLSDGTYEYVAVSGSTAIESLPGLEYFGLNVPGSTIESFAAANGAKEAQDAIGVKPRRISLTVAGGSYVVNSGDFTPAYHWATPTAADSINIDVSGISTDHEYKIIVGGVATGKVYVDCGSSQTLYFTTNWTSPSLTNITSFELEAGESVVLRRLGSNIIRAEKMSLWLQVSSAGAGYVRQPDGTYEVTFIRTASISASTESTSNIVSSIFDITNAYVESVTVQPDAGGTAPPDLPPQVTKMGTAHGLSANQFAIRNPNASTLAHPILVKFSNVVEV
jgi:hypothetical protein